MQFAIYPLELIRTRLAVCPEGTYAGLSAAAVSIWRTEGALAFYRGLLPSLVSTSAGHIVFQLPRLVGSHIS